jgi:hypothetical protein
MFACVSVFARNIEPLDADEQNALDTLEALQWTSDLSQQEVSLATNALTSSKDSIAAVALCVVIVHDLPGLKEMLLRGVGPSGGYSRLLSSAVLDGLKERKGAVESLCGSNLLKQDVELREKANHIIAVSVARMLRGGEVPKTQWEDLTFSSVDQKLLQYSKQPPAEAVNRIIRQLGQASVAGTDEYDLVRVLDSYEDVNVDAVLEAFKGEGTRVYGKVLLLVCVERRVSKMNDEDRQKVKSVLGTEEARDKRVERALKRVEKRLENTAVYAYPQS